MQFTFDTANCAGLEEGLVSGGEFTEGACESTDACPSFIQDGLAEAEAGIVGAFAGVCTGGADDITFAGFCRNQSFFM